MLRNGEYRIDGDGIWISKEVLEQWKKQYRENAESLFSDENPVLAFYYSGKADVFNDIMKMFEPLEGL
jgi:hypothetical protein